MSIEMNAGNLVMCHSIKMVVLAINGIIPQYNGGNMATVKPFKGLRPVKEMVEKVASNPYDVINSEEAREEVKGQPNSFLHVVKSEVDLDVNVDLYSKEVYEKARDNLNSLVDQNILFRDQEDRFYLYQQEMDGRVQTGVVGTASIDDYKNDVIKKHEFTRKSKEQDRINHVDYCDANTGPVFLTYRHNDELSQVVSSWINNHAPEYNFILSDKVRHTLWVVDDQRVIGKIQNLFQQTPCLYVADGHHRSAAAYKVGEMRRNRAKSYSGDEPFNYFLTVLFPDNELHILPYNRVVKDLNQLSSDEFMTRLSQNFVIESSDDAYSPTKRHQIGMYLDQKWYNLTLKEGLVDENDPVKSLDVSVLQELVLSPILGIQDPRTDSRIDFVGGIRGLGELEKRCNSGEMKIAFSMYPTSIEDLMRIADAGEVMPPKSTWFEPKLRSGLIINKLS